MSETIAYGYRRRPGDMAALCARKLYLDGEGSRAERAHLLADVRPGDVVRVLFFNDLGGPRWREWRDRLEAKGPTVEEHRPERKPPGRPVKAADAALTEADHAKAQAAWCDDSGVGLDDRLRAVGAVYGRKLTRDDRHLLYSRYGKPGTPKPLQSREV